MFNLTKKISNLKPIKNWKRQQLKKKLTNQSINIAYGQQDQLDMISYSGLKEESSYLQINDRYVRTLFVSGYPYVASTGWLNNLIKTLHSDIYGSACRDV